MPGLGPARRAALADAGVRDALDLLLTLPLFALDWRRPKAGADVLAALTDAPGDDQVVAASVERIARVPMRGRRALRASLRSESLAIEAWWFFASASLAKLEGPVLLAGVPRPPKRDGGPLRLLQPRLGDASRGIEPSYRLAELPSATIAHAIAGWIARHGVAGVSSLLPPDAPSELAEDLVSVHAPPTIEAFEKARDRLRARLAGVEARWLVRRRSEAMAAHDASRAHPSPSAPAAWTATFEALGIEPTAAQRNAIERIGAELSRTSPRQLLLTGDVGTGKTAVMLAAIAQAHAAGRSSLLLAPTRLLADQHVATAAPMARALGLPIVRWTSGRRVAHRSSVAQLYVGTHALLASPPEVEALGLVVIDEQHRLGVGQRLALTTRADARGARPHVLSVSATPIPRSLDRALRGWMETLHIDQGPPRRGARRTELSTRSAWPELLDEIAATVARGEAVMVVCPRIAASEGGELDGVEARAAWLRAALAGIEIVAVHGAAETGAVRAAVAAYREGRASVLVASTMVEIGLDVPRATLMLVDQAERFGLATLHQLRGRVGRSERASRCVLLASEPIGASAAARLGVMIEHDDGLAIAREDLRQRGPGDADGVRQSGRPGGLRWLDPLADEALLEAALVADAASCRDRPEPSALDALLFERLSARARLDGSPTTTEAA